MRQEILKKRTKHSKTFLNEDGSHTIELRINPIHYGKDLKDINIDMVPTPEGHEMREANYSLTIKGDKVRFKKEGEWIEFIPDRLQWINDEGDTSLLSKFTPTEQPRAIKNEIVWDNAFGEGIDLLYGAGYGGIYKKVILHDYIKPPDQILSGANPHLEVVLKYTKSDIEVRINNKKETFTPPRNIRLERVKFSNLWELKPPRFMDSGTIHSSAMAKMMDVGKRRMSHNEITTAAPHSWLVKAIYPLFIDADISEQVGLSTDDGSETNDTGISLVSGTGQIGFSTAYETFSYDVGARFQTVNIPKGSTISAAKLSVFLDIIGGELEAEIKGIDEDNTATWAAEDRPSQRAQTTATVSANKADWNNWALDVWIDIDISGIIQEIVDRAGWAANNALAVVIKNTGVADDYIYIRMYDYSGNLQGPKLDVTYTPPAVGQPTQLRTRLIPGMNYIGVPA